MKFYAVLVIPIILLVACDGGKGSSGSVVPLVVEKAAASPDGTIDTTDEGTSDDGTTDENSCPSCSDYYPSDMECFIMNEDHTIVYESSTEHTIHESIGNHQIFHVVCNKKIDHLKTFEDGHADLGGGERLPEADPTWRAYYINQPDTRNPYGFDTDIYEYIYPLWLDTGNPELLWSTVSTGYQKFRIPITIYACDDDTFDVNLWFHADLL